jgi:hypothetical protein
MSVSQVVTGLRSFTFQLLPGRRADPGRLVQDTRGSVLPRAHHLVSGRISEECRSHAGTRVTRASLHCLE